MRVAVMVLGCFVNACFFMTNKSRMRPLFFRLLKVGCQQQICGMIVTDILASS